VKYKKYNQYLKHLHLTSYGYLTNHSKPLLYDATSADHKDAQRIFNTWGSIAGLMGAEKMTDAKMHFIYM